MGTPPSPLQNNNTALKLDDNAVIAIFFGTTTLLVALVQTFFGWQSVNALRGGRRGT